MVRTAQKTLLLLALAGGSANLLQAQPPGRPEEPALPAWNPAAVGPNVQMNGPQSPMPDGRLGRPAEAIAADPDGKVLVAAWETVHGTCGGSFGGKCTPPKTPGVTAAGYSTDGGKTWTDLGAPFLGGNVMTSGRPWLDRGGKDNQTWFLASRAADVEAEAPPEPGSMPTPGGSNQEGLLLYRGRFQDGKLVWTDQHLFKPDRPLDLLRSPSILAAKDGSGRVWLAHSTLLGVCGRRGGSGGQISVRRSLDEGKTWEKPVLVSPDEFKETPDPKPDDMECGNKGAIQILPSLALGPTDEVYVTWQQGPDLLSLRPLALGHTTRIGFARSLDGGKTFAPAQVLATVSSMRDNNPVGYSKTTFNDIPRIAAATGGAHKGRVYVTYTSAVEEAPALPWDQLLVSSQVFLVWSDDQGKTWSKPVPLASDVPPKGLKRFWPTLAVRDDGTVDIIYMESQEKQITRDPGDIECNIMTVLDVTRAGRASSLIDVWWVQSTDGGASFGPPVRVSSETTNWCKVKYDYETTQFANFGDVLGIYTTGKKTFVVWPDGRNGVPDAYFAELKDYKAGAAAKPAGEAKDQKDTKGAKD